MQVVELAPPDFYDADVAPARSVPAPPTPLVGRDGELAELRALLAAPGHRLITLTGPPGVGKTRLALAVAEPVEDAVWVDLSGLRDTDQVLPEVGRALGVEGERLATPSIAATLTGRDVLVVLDNCEHLLGAGPELGALLAASPRLRILATSRERLHLAAERDYPVPPLPMPSDGDVADLDRLAANPAIGLLLARSPAHVRLTERSARALADICLRLDGLPLAIELAAPRLRVFTPGELAFRLADRTAMLTSGVRDAPVRHRDLRAAITWSHELLPEGERQVFRRLSVFVTPFTVESAEAVAGGPDILDALESLLDKSLIRRADGEGEARFTLLASLREFAADQLDAHGETGATRARHARHFADQARLWETSVGTDEETYWWPRIGTVHGDVKAAFEHSRSTPDRETRLWLACGLAWFGYTRGSLSDAAETRAEIARAAEDGPPDAAAAALMASGILAVGVGDLDGAEQDLTRVTALNETAGNNRRQGVVFAFLGHVARGRRDFAKAAEQHGAARALFARIHNSRGTAWAVYDLGMVAAEAGELSQAEALFREALLLLREQDYSWAVAVTAAQLAGVLVRGGATDEPARLLGEALALHEGVGDRRGIAQCFETLAEVALARGVPGTACRLLGASSVQRRVGAAQPTPVEEARNERLAGLLARTLGRAAADQELHTGRTMPVAAALALAHGVASAGLPTTADEPELTARQLEVAALITAGSTNRQIGRALGISEKTAEVHVRNIMERLHTPSRAGVAAWAAARGLIPPTP